jgi:hypothetical protein
VLTIPLKSLPDYTLEVTIDTVGYQFRVAWNERTEQWAMDILDRSNNLLVGGLGLVLNSELLQNHAGRSLPRGALMLIDASGSYADVSFDDLEERCALVYLTEAEYAAI